MKCPICKSEMACNQESYHYVESGLENVQLDGIDVFRCSCGEEELRGHSKIISHFHALKV